MQAHQALVANLTQEQLVEFAARYMAIRNGGLYDLPYSDHGAGPEFADSFELDGQVDALIFAAQVSTR
jgi:hypothetical protein